MQNHYNLLYREEEREMLPLCRAEGIGILPWSPLARGLLARERIDKEATERARNDVYGRSMYYHADDNAVVDAVTAVATRRGVPNAQVALAWLLVQPGITAPIIGATKASHLDDAVAALKLKLDADELAALAKPYRPHPVLGHS
jgi:aryl-alcohol dehydrogenase (NADP+)